MPRPCAVETHACCYKKRPKNFQRCHGLVPWSFTLNAFGSAEALAGTVTLHGTRPWHPQRVLLTYFVAASVKLHGARPWHLLSSHTVSSVGGIQKPGSCSHVGWI